MWLTLEDMTRMYEHAKLHEGRKYDYDGLVWRFLFGKRKADAYQDFCSEVCSHLFGSFGVSSLISPTDFYHSIKKIDGQHYSLPEDYDVLVLKEHEACVSVRRYYDNTL